MTSESNKKLPPKNDPKPVIGTLRPPNARDLYDRRVPGTRVPLQSLPDPTSSLAITRSSYEFEQAALRITRQAVIDVNSEFSSIREPPVPAPDPDLDSEDERDAAIEDALGGVLGEEEEEMVEDRFIAKVRRVEVEEVRKARGKGRLNPMQRFVMKVKAVGARGPVVNEPEPAAGRAQAGTSAGASAGARKGTRAGTRARASEHVPARPQVPSRSAPVLANAQPAATTEMTAAEAALALTNQQEGTQVLIEELRAQGDINDLDDDADMYDWVVGSVSTREMTIAEAALAMTNIQAGTSVTMDDLRTAREMVDLWDCEDVYVWTVGNVE